MNVLVWHVHGSWTTAFVHGPHRYLLPCVEDRGADGRGRAATWDWPPNAVDLPRAQAAEADVDVVVLQRPEDEELATAWLGGRRPGRDVPAVWVEHNAPQGAVNDMRHPAASRDDVVLVHVTHTNALFWDSGTTRTRVIEHGIVDPGYCYAGDIERGAVVVNEPVRRGRVAGTDLLPRFAAAAPIDVFGMQVGLLAKAPWFSCRRVGLYGDVPQRRLHDQVARRRAYIHPYRWTSLGLALLEAMHLGMPVVCLATTEAHDAVPAAAGFVSNDVGVLTDGLRRLMAEPEAAAQMGLAARTHALRRFGLDRFLTEWNVLLEEVTA